MVPTLFCLFSACSSAITLREGGREGGRERERKRERKREREADRQTDKKKRGGD